MPTIDKTCWIKGLPFIGGIASGGGQGPAFIMRSAPGRMMRLYANRCGFSYGNGFSCLTVGPTSSGPGLAIVKDCFGGYGNLDWFNPHGVANSALNAESWNVVEVNSRADWAGWSTSNTNNGTTNHEAGYHVLVGCSYLNAQDRPVHMIQSTRSWLLGCEVSTRRGGDASDQSAGYVVANPSETGLTSILWLDACRVIAPPKVGAPVRTTAAYPTGTLNHANLAFTPTAGGFGGTVAAYTP